MKPSLLILAENPIDTAKLIFMFNNEFHIFTDVNKIGKKFYLVAIITKKNYRELLRPVYLKSPEKHIISGVIIIMGNDEYCKNVQFRALAYSSILF